ncbi:TPA: polymerase [Streptococcus suis]|nr:polymerase [Streptococcus suis]
MKIHIHRAKFTEFLILGAFSIYLSFGLLTTSLYSQYINGTTKLVIILTLAPLLICEIASNYNVKTILSIIVLSVLLFIGLEVSDGTSQLLLMEGLIFIFCLREISFDKIAKMSLYISIILLFTVVFSSKIGLIPNFVLSSGGRIRYFLGFRYALYPSTIMTNITLLFVWLKGTEIKKKQLILLLGLNFWMYVETDSRLTFIVACLVLVISILLKIFPSIINKRTFLMRLLIPSYITSAILSYWLTVSYNPFINWYYSLNSFLGRRLSLGQYSLNTYGFTLFGQNISWVGNGLDIYGNQSTSSYLYVDSLYIQILQRYGLIFLIIILLILSIMMVRIYQKDDYLLLVLLSITAMHGIIDDLILYLYFNPLWILVGIIISQNYCLRKDKN